MRGLTCKKNTIITISFLAAGAVLFYGCGKTKEKGESPVVAVINSYKLTVDDFRDEAKLTMHTKALSDDPLKAKEEFLEEIITKKILIQEAQKENFDKDKTFMKEIERYWEQALLKLLVKKKMKEFSGEAIVRNDEIQAEYERLVTEEGRDIGPFAEIAPEVEKNIRQEKTEEMFYDWIDELFENSKIKINKDILKEIEIE